MGKFFMWVFFAPRFLSNGILWVLGRMLELAVSVQPLIVVVASSCILSGLGYWFTDAVIL